jgi:hypothetical protein
MLATAIVGTDPAGAVMLFGSNLRPPGSERLFIDPILSLGYFGSSDAYTDGNPNFTDERAGSNESHEGNFVEGSGVDNLARVRFKYVLPIGRGKDRVIDTYRVEAGVPVAGPECPTSFNPFTSGKTYLELSPFYRRLEIDSDELPTFDLATNGLELSLYWDNRDFYVNPTRGQSVRWKLAQDYGLADSSGSWSANQVEVDQYVSLGSNLEVRQCVLALDFWTAYSPSWEELADGTIDNRPPPFYGSTLGGLWRLRGYPPQRFSDKAAIYYSPELRVMPEWNPFLGWPSLQSKLGVQWIQIVPFVDVGRVAPEWDLSELHTDMKWDYGLGLRALAQGIVLRLDAAKSDEDFAVRMMIGHPFQF